jgi:hypothetical protein
MKSWAGGKTNYIFIFNDEIYLLEDYRNTNLLDVLDRYMKHIE